MSEKSLNIIAGVLTIFVVGIYFAGMFIWTKNEHVNKVVGSNIYFKCAFSAMYMMSFIIFLLARNRPLFVKPITAGANSFFAVVLYQDIVHGDRAWHSFSYWFIVVVTANFFILYCLIEKIKNKVGYK